MLRGLPFIAQDVVRAINDDLVRHLSCGLHLLNHRCWLLLLLLARSLELQQGHSFQYTYLHVYAQDKYHGYIKE
jgi:hypothetical protein